MGRILTVQRKKAVDLSSPVLSCGACFEVLPCVFASASALLEQLYARTAAGKKPSCQLLKKVAQATPMGLLHLFVLSLTKFSTYFFISSLKAHSSLESIRLSMRVV